MRIKTAIQEQEFRPGERMREADLAAWLGISRTPMRDALKQLEADGLLEAAPRRGLVVATMDQQRLGEIYALRDVLEALSARLAAQHATQAEIATLERNIARQAETPKEDTVALIRLNRQFHDTIYRASRNRYLVAALHALETPLSLLSGTTYSHPDRPAEALRQHRDLAAAIAAREVDLAESAAREHMLAGERIRLEMLSDLDDWDADGNAG
jgi:DNA-binding GntR family transcriptional regulator